MYFYAINFCNINNKQQQNWFKQGKFLYKMCNSPKNNRNVFEEYVVRVVKSCFKKFRSRKGLKSVLISYK